MDGWPHMNRLERDLTLIGGVVLGVASMIGAVVGWVGYQLFEHLHHETPSEHFRR